ncbi:hypothetical protein C0993_011486 [Termitomyces sp. T159_Od127]|nr:hypothetical protein C0993_011486 [Termitomyces sp. T159_Od127]
MQYEDFTQTELNVAANMKLDKLLAGPASFNTQTYALRNDVKMWAHLSYRDSGEPDVLPPRPRVFVGRDDIVQNTTKSLLNFHNVALIGPGGIGKSTIARAVLNDERIAYRFRGRRFFARFDDMDARQVNLGTFLDQIARALGLVTSVNVHNLISKTLSTSDTLLVLDNAETFLDSPVDAGRISDVIDGLGARLNVAILITTRTTSLPPNVDWVRLRVSKLEKSAACEAFRAYYPSFETSILTKLLAAVDFHPLSINLLAQAAVQNEWSPQELITAWYHQHAALLETGDGKLQSIAVTVETSLNSPSFVKLGAMIRHLLHIIAFLPQGISKTRLIAIFPGVPNMETYADALCRQSIVYLDADFITLLAPIRLHILNRYKIDTSTNPLLRELRRYYAAHIGQSQIVVAEDVNIEYVLNHWLRDTGGNIETILDVLRTTDRFLFILLAYRPRPVSLHPVVSALDVSKLSNSVSCMNFCVAIPILQKPKSLLRNKATSLFWISLLMRVLGQIEEAKNVYVQARTLALEAGDLDQLVFLDGYLAEAYRYRGDLRTAEGLFETALNNCSGFSTLFRLDPRTKATIELGIIEINILKGRPDAVQRYLNFLSTLKRKRIQLDLSFTNYCAGYLELHNGHLDVAQRFFEEVQASDDEYYYSRRRRFIALADVAYQRGDYAKSKALRAQLLESIKVKPDPENFIITKALLAASLAKEGDMDCARKLINPLVKHAAKYVSPEVLILYHLAGMVELTDEKFDEAADYFRKTIEICKSVSVLVIRARSYRALGEISVAKRDLSSAKKNFETTTKLCKTMDLPRERLYFSFTCYVPRKTFDGWNLYQGGHAMFSHMDDRSSLQIESVETSMGD